MPFILTAFVDSMAHFSFLDQMKGLLMTLRKMLLHAHQYVLEARSPTARFERIDVVGGACSLICPDYHTEIANLV